MRFAGETFLNLLECIIDEFYRISWVSMFPFDEGAIRCSSPAGVSPSRFESKLIMPAWLIVGLRSFDWSYACIDVVMSIIDSSVMLRTNGLLTSFCWFRECLATGVLLLFRFWNMLIPILLFTFEISWSRRRIAFAVVLFDAGTALPLFLVLFSFDWFGLRMIGIKS